MENLVTVVKENVVVSSRDVAEHFEKRHDHVIRDIEMYKKDIPNFEEMFQEATMPDSYGRQQKAYLMNRDGFSLLVMGFTGAKALEWKLKYIEAFNAMEKELNNIRLDVIRKETKRNVRNTIRVHCNNPFVLKREKDDVSFRDSWFRQNQFVKNEPMKAIQ